MKKMILILLWIPVIVSTSCHRSNYVKQVKNNTIMQNSKEEKEGILRAIDLYVEGGRTGNGKTAAEAFAPTATMSWAENGALKSVPIQALYDHFDQTGSLQASYELTTLDVAGNAAIVRIESQFGPTKFADMFTLVKDGSKWKILSKIYQVK